METKPRSGASLQGVADLREISKFVIGILKDEKSFLGSLEQSPEEEKLNCHLHLAKISSHIESYNKGVDSSFLIGVVHVVLLILTLGIFHYKDTLRIENFTSPLQKLGIGQQQLAKLSFGHLVSMRKEDREAILKEAGLEGKWTAFVAKHPEPFDLSDLERAIVFTTPLSLERLQRADDFEKTPLIFMSRQVFLSEYKAFPMKAIVLLADVLVPYLQSIRQEELKEISQWHYFGQYDQIIPRPVADMVLGLVAAFEGEELEFPLHTEELPPRVEELVEMLKQKGTESKRVTSNGSMS